MTQLTNCGWLRFWWSLPVIYMAQRFCIVIGALFGFCLSDLVVLRFCMILCVKGTITDVQPLKNYSFWWMEMVNRTIFWCKDLVHPTQTTNKNWLFRCLLNREKRKPQAFFWRVVSPEHPRDSWTKRKVKWLFACDNPSKSTFCTQLHGELLHSKC